MHGKPSGLGAVWRMVALLLAVTLIAAGCGDDDSGGASDGSGDSESASTEPFRAVWLGPKSGPVGQTGLSHLAGLEVAVDRINADGGIGGREVVLESHDTEADPARAVSELQRALSEGTIDFLMPGITSGEVQAVLPVATREQIITMSPAAAAVLGDPEQFPYHFATSAGSDPNAVLAAHVADQGITRVALMHSVDEYGESMGSRYEEELANNDVEVVDIATFAITDVDMSAQIARLSDTDAEALVFEATGRASFPILQAIADARWDVPIFGGQAVESSFFDGTIPDDVLQRLTVGGYRPSLQTFAQEPEANSVREEAAAAGADFEVTDGYLTFTGYDYLWLIGEAAARADGSFAADDLAAVMRSETFERGDGGWLSFSYAWSDETNFLQLEGEDVPLMTGTRTEDLKAREPVEG
jgi:ABC-type branched-subunit amino acid transport system substrate-binding protein